MDSAVRNMVEQAGLPLEAALPLAAEVPAAILGVADRKGKIADGYDADVAVLSPQLAVERVFGRGRELRQVTGTGSGTPCANDLSP
jgi:N-acetylglucosamine-6-phosphate deacetylase